VTLENSKLARTFHTWFTLPESENIDTKKILHTKGRICFDSPGNYTFFAVLTDTTVPVMLNSRGNTYDLDHYLPRQNENERFTQITEVTQVAGKQGNIQIQLTLVFFPGAAGEMGDLHIGIDERIIETAEKNNISFLGSGSKAEALGSLLKEKCSISVGPESYFLMLAGGAADTDTTKENTPDAKTGEHNDNEETIRQDNSRLDAPAAFTICGDGVVLPVEYRTGPDGEEYFAAIRLVYRKAVNGESGLQLVHARLKFFDWTRSGEKISVLQKGMLEKMAASPQFYLNLWDNYTRMEGEKLLREAREFGVYRYQNIVPAEKGRGFQFFMAQGEEYPGNIEKSQAVEFVDDLPPYLKNEKLTWDDFQELLSQERAKKDKPKQAHVYGSIRNFSKVQYYITVEMNDKPEGKYMVLSIHGDMTQITRRQKARDAILQQRSANPALGILIEDGAEVVKAPRKHSIEPLTPFIREKIFQGRDIRDAQREAIETALNTPDIALIQGPPGTGKTTVIAAILERLNELYGKTGVSEGRILVSSSQHDAVENLAERLRINSIPAVKFGKRQSRISEKTHYERTLDNWRKELAEKISESHPDIAHADWRKAVQRNFEMYIASPSASLARELLERIMELPHEIIDNDIIDRIVSIQAELEDEHEQAETDIIRMIRTLRITESAFLDDGPERALGLLDALDTLINEEQCQILTAAAMWNPEKTDISFLKDLRDMKRELLLRFTPKPYYRMEKPRADILELITIVNRQIEKSQNFDDKKEMALAAFWNELNNNPKEIQDALKNYSVVYASTVQFAGSEEMSDIKNTGRNAADVPLTMIYDTVIIDEAARVSPPDLLIPLSQAEKRIILVGDHRQLPQLVEDDLIERAIENEDALDAAKMRQAYHKSMFEYLVKRLKQLSGKDGIKRIARLDAQYRMHPFLGNFVSEHFYYRSNGDEDDFDERYDSPLDDEEFFKHNLPGTKNKSAVWIDMPSTRNDRCEKDERKSWYRICEAERIAEKIAEWIDVPGPDGKQFSFGVISFYTAQTNRLNGALFAKDICGKNADGDIQVKDKYSDRLLVGTVDAFQGREFDIVFLSLVRSFDVRGMGITDRLKTRTFGHLLSVNRLCVGMSRQKKALIIAGDTTLMQSDLARDAVPALYDFCKVCRDGIQGIML
jgi:hypothetical protein